RVPEVHGVEKRCVVEDVLVQQIGLAVRRRKDLTLAGNLPPLADVLREAEKVRNQEQAGLAETWWNIEAGQEELGHQIITVDEGEGGSFITGFEIFIANARLAVDVNRTVFWNVGSCQDRQCASQAVSREPDGAVGI